MVQKLLICEKVYFDQLLDFPTLLLCLHTLSLCHIQLFECWIFSIPSGCQTDWVQMRPDILPGLIWVQTVCKGYQQIPKLPLADKELNTEQLLDTGFWLKPWLKAISFGFNFFHLAKVLATTNSESGKALIEQMVRYILQNFSKTKQILLILKTFLD